MTTPGLCRQNYPGPWPHEPWLCLDWVYVLNRYTGSVGFKVFHIVVIEWKASGIGAMSEIMHLWPKSYKFREKTPMKLSAYMSIICSIKTPKFWILFIDHDNVCFAFIFGHILYMYNFCRSLRVIYYVWQLIMSTYCHLILTASLPNQLLDFNIVKQIKLMFTWL